MDYKNEEGGDFLVMFVINICDVSKRCVCVCDEWGASAIFVMMNKYLILFLVEPV
jgi:uncharacterized Fe-S cluster protein YjdI